MSKKQVRDRDAVTGGDQDAERGDSTCVATLDPPAEGVELHTRASEPAVDILAITNRISQEYRDKWKGTIEPLRNRMMKQCRKQGMGKLESQEWTYSELDRLYPPIPDPPEPEVSTDISPAKPSDDGRVQGIGDIPDIWGELPHNANLAVELAWVQSHRLSVVEERPSGATVVHLDRAKQPAPSWAALGWLETSIRSYAKYVDVVAKSLATQQDDQETVRRERLRGEEIRSLLEGNI